MTLGAYILEVMSFTPWCLPQASLGPGHYSWSVYFILLGLPVRAGISHLWLGSFPFQMIDLFAVISNSPLQYVQGPLLLIETVFVPVA